MGPPRDTCVVWMAADTGGANGAKGMRTRTSNVRRGDDTCRRSLDSAASASSCELGLQRLRSLDTISGRTASSAGNACHPVGVGAAAAASTALRATPS